MNNKRFLFRFVPTMRCNFNCKYCFEGDSSKRPKETMFDIHPVKDWIEGMKLFSDKEIEIYMWGGEPFILNDTYKLLREWMSMDHIVSGCRIDTNTFFADKIVNLCPSNKIKLNCSYHMQYHTLEQQYEKIKKLKELDMVGMMNFVASESNITSLHKDYNMTVFDLIKMFSDIGVFVNIAGDFSIANNINHPRHKEYMDFILQFISPKEWNLLRGEKEKCKCSAGMHFFTINYDGSITSCIDNRIYGNFFEGIIKPEKKPKTCKTSCQSLISYPWKTNNDLSPWNSLLEYVNRNTEYRKAITIANDFVF
ncbi:MAG: radical SAM protein [Clostridia bacterium]|nr:radical SAM protein [Clostridia bacterium]